MAVEYPVVQALAVAAQRTEVAQLCASLQVAPQRPVRHRVHGALPIGGAREPWT